MGTPKTDTSLQDRLVEFLGSRLRDEAYNKNKTIREAQTVALKQEVANHFSELDVAKEAEKAGFSPGDVSKAFEGLPQGGSAAGYSGARRETGWTWPQGHTRHLH